MTIAHGRYIIHGDNMATIIDKDSDDTVTIPLILISEINEAVSKISIRKQFDVALRFNHIDKNGIDGKQYESYIDEIYKSGQGLEDSCYESMINRYIVSLMEKR